jgi:hypothetical protein
LSLHLTPGCRLLDARQIEFGFKDLMSELGVRLITYAAEADPNRSDVIEQTQAGIWGWVDDELAILKPWGFDCQAVTIPTAIDRP